MNADVLPDGWSAVPLKEVVTTRSGNSNLIKGKLSSTPGDGLFPAFSASGQDVWHEQAEHQGEAVVVSAVGARCGKAFLACGEWSAIANTHVVWPGEQIDTRFLWHMLNDERFWVRGGSAQAFVRMRDSLERIVPVPPLDEQRRIVEAIETHLSHLDAGVESLQRAKRNLERMRAAALEHVFSNVGAGTVPLAEVADVRLGRQRSPENHSGPFMRPYVRAANVTWRGIDLTDVKEMNFDPSASAGYRLRRGDVLLSEGSGSALEVGKPAVWMDEIEECYIQNTLIRVRPGESVTSEYLHRYFMHQALTARFSRAARGVNIQHLGSATLASWPTPLPTLAEQSDIVAEVDTQLSRIEALTASTHQTEGRVASLRRGILAAAFSGRLAPRGEETAA